MLWMFQTISQYSTSKSCTVQRTKNTKQNRTEIYCSRINRPLLVQKWKEYQPITVCTWIAMVMISSNHQCHRFSLKFCDETHRKYDIQWTADAAIQKHMFQLCTLQMWLFSLVFHFFYTKYNWIGQHSANKRKKRSNNWCTIIWKDWIRTKHKSSVMRAMDHWVI